MNYLNIVFHQRLSTKIEPYILLFIVIRKIKTFLSISVLYCKNTVSNVITDDAGQSTRKWLQID